MPINSHISNKDYTMALTTQAQTHFIEVVELNEPHSMEETWEPEMEFTQSPEMTLALHPETPSSDVTEVPDNLELVVDELPGVEDLDPELEHALELLEKSTKEEKEKDENDVKNTKKPTKWDWEGKGASGFVVWIQERLHDVPKHSGYDSAGLERACAYMQKLDDEISRAMRLDLDGELDADKIEEVRSKIDDGIERLYARLDKVKKKKGGKKRKKAEEQMELIKQAQKMPSISGIVITVPLYVSGICRALINGMVSGGKDIEDSFEKLAHKYKLTDREKMECIYHLQDMGLTVRRDRGLFPDEDFDPTSADNIEFPAQWPH